MQQFKRMLIVATLAAFCWMGCKTVDKNAHTNNYEQEKADAKYMFAKLKEGRTLNLNFADSIQLRFYKNLLRRSGYTETSHPQFFAVLEQNRLAHVAKAPEMFESRAAQGSTTEPIQQITSFNTNDHIKYNVSGLSSIPTEVLTSTISLSLYVPNGDTIGPAITETVYNYSRDLQGSTFGIDSAAIADKLKYDTVYATFAYFYMTPDGVAHYGTQLATTTNVVDSIININPMPCTLGQPVNACDNNPCGDTNIITVCMTRKTPNCTYCSPGLVPNFMFPVTGYVIYDGNVSVDGNGKPNNGAFANITVTKLPAGGGCAAIPLSGNFFDYVTVTGNKLSWNIPGAMFQNTCLASGDSVLYQLTLFVKVGPTYQPAFATVTNASDAVTNANQQKIPAMNIVSGCIAKGTMITLADGLQKKIEDVPMLAKLKNGEDKTAYCVEYNTIGREPKDLIRIQDDKGHQLLVTEDHPIVGVGFIKPAKDLKEKDKIQTDKGEATIISLKHEKYDGEVWNLALSKCESNDPKPGNDNATFFANGILVGDSRMQSYYKYFEPMQQENALKKLPKEWHTDYHSTQKLNKRKP
ncbi:intein [Chitinophaga skermanii]|uniref:Intein n=1 Tax=Chitinophaga skermanii TaxID=331697 RepID=A0A327QL60_9BACT|nr:Hint domain-containing protein [Chitinophaga skermanii]RAJ05030.1 intein [Chitinophaga skermanii]